MAPPALAELLHANPVFAAVALRELQPLAALAREQSYRPREIIFAEGEPALWFCLVRSGHVKIVRAARGGRDVVLELLGPGEPFGGVAVLERRDYPASAQATEPTVVVMIPRDPLVALSERHPSIVREMALMIGRRLRGAHTAVTSLAADPVETRLAAALVRLAEREGTGGAGGVGLPSLTRQSLADMTGTTVETTIRTLGRWLKSGLLVERDGRLRIPDMDALRALAEGDAS
ncbi:MAG TPA: Crp/Fnr family transcriptional regulator [Candidatus Binatia bacterium]|nr:Crp/Fnr family transcriptional regulator [Candidatus Binatia bacterium]